MCVCLQHVAFLSAKYSLVSSFTPHDSYLFPLIALFLHEGPQRTNLLSLRTMDNRDHPRSHNSRPAAIPHVSKGAKNDVRRVHTDDRGRQSTGVGRVVEHLEDRFRHTVTRSPDLKPACWAPSGEMKTDVEGQALTGCCPEKRAVLSMA